MSGTGNWWSKTRQIAALVLLFLSPLAGRADDSRGGRIVWWGSDEFWQRYYNPHTNGVIEVDNEILSNVVGIAAGRTHALALKNDGTTLMFGRDVTGGTFAPTGWSNVASISIQGRTYWAVRTDGTIARLGGNEFDSKIVAGIRDVASIVMDMDYDCVVLKRDGTLAWIHAEGPDPPDLPRPGNVVYPVQVGGKILSNITAAASVGDALIVLRNDGFLLHPSGRSDPRQPPFEFETADPVTIDGRMLTNVIAISGCNDHGLALKSDGTVVGLGRKIGEIWPVPDGLTKLTAIAADEGLDMALKSDGTVVAWGTTNIAQTAVPAGLSNVIAIASAGWFGMALTTGEVPPSVYIRPHGALEEMERESDLIFKGQAISSVAITNTGLLSSMGPHRTKFKVISVVKGELKAKEISLQHHTGNWGWGGGPHPPAYCRFEPGQCYLVFASRLDKPDMFYKVPPGLTNAPDEFRQFAGVTWRDDQGFLRMLDARSLAGQSMKDAHWFELNLLLKDTKSTNQLYAIEQLDWMSLAGRRSDEWSHSGDFKRKTVLTALLPLITNRDEQVAARALSCFATESNAAVRLAPFAAELVKVANGSPFASCRFAAIAALSGEQGTAVSNSLARLLTNSDENIRISALTLLPRFPREFSEDALQKRATEKSPYVRSVLADVIGAGRYVERIPSLAKLFAESRGVVPVVRPLPEEAIWMHQRGNGCGDVHDSAGYALLEFRPEQVADILKTNLNDPAFHVYFLAKLAEEDAEPWLPELAVALESRVRYVEEVSKMGPEDPRRYSDPFRDSILTGAYSRCWEDIRKFLLKLPPEKLSGGTIDRYMDLLDNTVRPVPGCPSCGVEQAKSLYELYRTKVLSKRADEIRRRFEKSEGWWFDDYDKNH